MFKMEKASRIFLLTFLCVVIIFSLQTEAFAANENPGKAWAAYARGLEYLEASHSEKALQKFHLAVSYNPNNAGYQRKLGELLETLERFEEAADAFEAEAAVRRRLGEEQAALVQERRARSLRSELKVFFQTEGMRKPADPSQLALFEPPAGLYFGVFVEQDRNVGGNNPGEFNRIVGKPQTIFFNYHPYGRPFAYNWTRLVKEQGAAVHIALEPRPNLEMVEDNEYLRQFARDMAAAEVPIFLRFASEMNGDWVPWHGDPELYIEKWRLLTRVVREETSNVAMVWAPNSVPLANIMDYYPGDDYVDWVGVNLYSVAYFDGDPERPAARVNPLDLIAPIYEAFADSKPIMVAEFGATHFTTATNSDTTKFSITKMRQLYHGVQMLFPRVKNINWFSVNTITCAPNPARRLNNFSLTENQQLLNAYREMLRYPYFLSQVVNGPFAAPLKEYSGPIVLPLPEAGVLEGPVTLQSWVRTHDPFLSRLEYRLNGVFLAAPVQMPYAVTFHTADLFDGEQLLEVTAYDSQGRPAITRKYSFQTRGGKQRQERVLRLTLGESEALVDGIATTMTRVPFLKEGVTKVPLRFISEKLGAEVKWEAGTITLRRRGKEIQLQSGVATAWIDGIALSLPQPPLIQAGVTFVPLRFIAEKFHAEVHYERGVITIRDFL